MAKAAKMIDIKDMIVEVEVYDEETVMPCLIETIKQTLEFVGYIYIMSTLFLFITRQFFRTHERCHHITSIATGLALIYCTHFLTTEIELMYTLYAIFLILYPYLLFKMYIPLGRKGIVLPLGMIVSTIFISILIHGEFYIANHYGWLKFRGLLMVAMMKIISIAVDHENGTQIPTFLEYCGYMFCPGNVILGPWVDFNEYYNLYTNKKTITMQWFWNTISSYMISIAYICGSNCVFAFYLTNDMDIVSIMYREAIMFRMSHYFISAVSSGSMMCAGFSDARDKWSYNVALPSEIECPRSLTTVVMYWNIPTHTFLKKYVFSVTAPYGKFIALLATFIGSAMLHGLSVEVTIVLLHLGLFSYVQNRFQNASAVLFNACIKSRPCRPNCSHIFKKSSWITSFLNFNFALITIFYLLYIGCIMDVMNYDQQTGWADILLVCVTQWDRVYFAGHFIMIITFIVSILLEVFTYYFRGLLLI